MSPDRHQGHLGYYYSKRVSTGVCYYSTKRRKNLELFNFIVRYMTENPANNISQSDVTVHTFTNTTKPLSKTENGGYRPQKLMKDPSFIFLLVIGNSFQNVCAATSCI